MIRRMSLLAPAMAALVTLFGGLAHAEGSYPERPIHLIVPLAAGSAVDAAARIITQKMSTNMNGSFVIENIDGAAGQIGANRVAKAAPDGYVIGAFNDSIMTMLPNTQAHLPWNILKDFAPVSLVATVDWGLVASPGSSYKTAADVIAAAKARPTRSTTAPAASAVRSTSRWRCSWRRPASR